MQSVTLTPFSCTHSEESSRSPASTPVVWAVCACVSVHPSIHRWCLQPVSLFLTRVRGTHLKHAEFCLSCVIPHSRRRPPEAAKSSARGHSAQRPTEGLTSLGSQRITTDSCLYFSLTETFLSLFSSRSQTQYHGPARYLILIFKSV